MRHEHLEPCWTGLASRTICSRAGLGCPLPHPNDPPELRLHHPRGTLHRTPTVAYPDFREGWVCPDHYCSTSHGRVTWCQRCPRWKQILQARGLTGWTRQRRRVGRAKRRFMRKLRAMDR